MTDPPYITPLDDVEARGWSHVAPDLWLTTEPLYDRNTGLYARLTYQGALDAAALLGASLATADDVATLHADAARGVAIELPPVTLPSLAMVHGSGLVGPYEARAQALRILHMAGLDWARIHDEGMRALLVAAGWDGVERVAGAGKHWVAGAPTGRAYLFGWWDGRRWIQPRPEAGSRGPHDRGHHDYATTTLLRRTTAPC